MRHNILPYTPSVALSAFLINLETCAPISCDREFYRRGRRPHAIPMAGVIRPSKNRFTVDLFGTFIFAEKAATVGKIVGHIHNNVFSPMAAI